MKWNTEKTVGGCDIAFIKPRSGCNPHFMVGVVRVDKSYDEVSWINGEAYFRGARVTDYDLVPEVEKVLGSELKFGMMVKTDLNYIVTVDRLENDDKLVLLYDSGYVGQIRINDYYIILSEDK